MFLIHRGHTVSHAARRPPQRSRNTEQLPQAAQATAKFSSVLSSTSPLLPRSRSIVPSGKAPPALADQRSRLFQRFCAEGPWKQPPVAHAARLAPSLLPRHPNHPLPAAAPVWPKRNLTFFSTTSPNPWSLFFLPVFFFVLFSFSPWVLWL